MQVCSAGLIADVQFDRPVVAVQHSCVATWWLNVRSGPLPEDFRWRRDCVEDGLNRAAAVVAPTAAFAAQTIRAYGIGRPILSVHNGRDPIPLTGRSRSDFVLTVGRLWDEGKNVRVLDEAAACIDVPVEAIGGLEGPDGSRISFDHLQAPGSLAPAAIATRLSARPIFASAALYEPFGLSALEAAQAGCALVLSDIPTFRELWSGSAIFVSPRDPAAYVEAIESLIADPERRQRMGQAAQLRALDYTPAAMARQMSAIYEQVLAPTLGDLPIQMAGAA